MDYGHSESEPRRSGSFSRISSTHSSFRRTSLNRLGSSHHEIDDDSVSEAGDIGDRALHSRRYSGSGIPRFSFDNLGENVVLPIQEHSAKEPPLPIASPASPGAILLDKDQNEEHKKELPWFLTYISSRVHLAVLGILGVLTRYLLEKLFGPQLVGATGDHSYMYIDLPPNMVGSFFMGWFGAVFKGDISKFSPELAVGLTTGYLGSLTTFSGWNQKMLELSADGHWVFSFLGFFLGLFLVAYSFIFGVETANGLKWALNRGNLSSKCGFSRANNMKSQIILIVVMVTLLGLLWGVSVTLLNKDFDGGSSTSHLWFGCIVGPVGVWIRFYLARLNGQGLGTTQMMKWMPFGTLIANVAAACIMAAFATMKKSVNSKHFGIVATGIQFGLCGCLSTVSNFHCGIYSHEREHASMARLCLRLHNYDRLVYFRHPHFLGSCMDQRLVLARLKCYYRTVYLVRTWTNADLTPGLRSFELSDDIELEL